LLQVNTLWVSAAAPAGAVAAAVAARVLTRWFDICRLLAAAAACG